MGKADLTIIVPVYNEQESLPKFKEEMDVYLKNTPVKSTVLFVNDGSKDNSLRIIKSIVEADKNYSFISLKNNGGLSTAMKAGFDFIETPYIGYIDSDLQTSPQDFNNYFKYLNDYAMVNGIRANRHDGIVKKLSSRIANNFRRNMVGDKIKDTCCPLKIMHTSYVNKMPFFKGMHRFLPALIMLQGGKVKEVEVQHFERYAGTAKYNLLNRLITPLIDTLVFSWIRKRNITYQIAELHSNGGRHSDSKSLPKYS